MPQAPAGSRCRTDAAAWRTPTGCPKAPAAASEEECDAEFPFVHLLILVAVGENDVLLEFPAQEKAARQVVAQAAARVRRLLGAVIGLRQSGFRLGVHHAGS